MKAVGFECDLDIQKSYEDEGRWIVEGFATTTDLDFQEDVISQEAIDHSAKDLLENSTVLYNHNAEEPIGKVEGAEARQQGLWIKIYISKTVPEIWTRIKEGILNKFSIKGSILEAKKEWMEELKRYARVISRMQLYEVSLVAVPANAKAKAISWYVEKALSKSEEEEEPQEEDGQKERQGGEEMDKEQIVIEEELVTGSGDPVKELTEVEKSRAAWASYCGKNGLEKKGQEDVWEAWTQFCKQAGLPLRKQPNSWEKIKSGLAVVVGEGKEEGVKSLVDQLGALGKENESMEKAGAKVSKARLARLKKLLSEFMAIVNEVDTQEESEKGSKPDLAKQLGELEGRLSELSKALGVEMEKKDESRPVITEMLKEMSKRLDVIENAPAVKTSIDGQEELAEGKGKTTIWKGLI